MSKETYHLHKEYLIHNLKNKISIKNGTGLTLRLLPNIVVANETNFHIAFSYLIVNNLIIILII